jgi:hypothetical protein
MKKNIVAAVVGLGLAAAVMPQPARALPPVYCSSPALQVCAALSASTSGNATDGWHLKLHVWNLFTTDGLNHLSHVITFAGIGSGSWTGSVTAMSAKVGNSITTWKMKNDPNSNVVGAEIDAGAATQNGITNGLVGCDQPFPPGKYRTCFDAGDLSVGPYLELDFTTSDEFVLSDAVYGWHSQAVNGTSCSLWVDSQGNQTQSSAADTCSSVVPEPVTMMLLGTGLTSMGGFGLLRRRKRNGDVGST